MSLYGKLSRRERQIMDILLELGQATASEVRSRLPDPPSYSATRAMLANLEDKGHIGHTEQGPHYVYSPRISRTEVRRSAVWRLVNAFFDHSASIIRTFTTAPSPVPEGRGLKAQWVRS